MWKMGNTRQAKELSSGPSPEQNDERDFFVSVVVVGVSTQKKLHALPRPGVGRLFQPRATRGEGPSPVTESRLRSTLYFPLFIHFKERRPRRPQRVFSVLRALCYVLRCTFIVICYLGLGALL